MDIAVRAFPILEGKGEEVRRFARELQGERATEAAGFYSRYGISRETWHLQETPQGLWVIAVTQVFDRDLLESVAAYAGSDDDFDVWFRSRVREITGVDPEQEPLGPPTEPLFDTRDLRKSIARRD